MILPTSADISFVLRLLDRHKEQHPADSDYCDELYMKFVNHHGTVRQVEKEALFVPDNGGPWFNQYGK